MLKKTFKMRARTGGMRRKISKKHAFIMSYSDPTSAQQNDSCKVNCSDNKDGSVGHQNQVAPVIIEKTHDTESLCIKHSIIVNNENIEQDRIHSFPLDAENVSPESSDESGDDSSIDKYGKCSSFRENIRRWAIERNIHQIALKDLTKIINGLIPEILPTDPRTLLKTPRCVIIKKIEGGEYWHNGITHNLTLLLEKWTDVPENISLNFNLDGLPIFKSSKKEFWPILCNIYENPKIKPLVIGIYYGIGKPKNITAYLEDFVTDLSNLLETGITLLQNPEKKVTVSIRCFICDSPARAFIKGNNVLY